MSDRFRAWIGQWIGTDGDGPDPPTNCRVSLNIWVDIELTCPPWRSAGDVADSLIDIICSEEAIEGIDSAIRAHAEEDDLWLGTGGVRQIGFDGSSVHINSISPAEADHHG